MNERSDKITEWNLLPPKIHSFGLHDEALLSLDIHSHMQSQIQKKSQTIKTCFTFYYKISKRIQHE
jgi:hypothetical protein